MHWTYLLEWFLVTGLHECNNGYLQVRCRRQIHLECVCQCSSGCFSNSFSCRNTCQWCFFKIIFNINTSKRSKKYKPHSILTKKKWNLIKYHLKRNTKRYLRWNSHPPSRSSLTMVAIIDFFALKKLLNLQLLLLHYTFNYIISYWGNHILAPKRPIMFYSGSCSFKFCNVNHMVSKGSKHSF